VEGALQALLDAKGPALLHVAIDTAANVWPLVPPNRSNAEMLHSSPLDSSPLDDSGLDDSRLDPQAEPAPANPTNPQEATHALPA
jgi:acetolactate synthase I/II/III large subunit